MKNNIIIVIIAFIVLGYFVFDGVNNYIDELNEQIVNKDAIIESLTDSNLQVDEKLKEYSETITKYIRDCNVMIGEKKYSFSEFINLYVGEIEKNNKIQDSLNKVKILYEASKEKYGAPYVYTRKNDSIIELINTPTKADTALAYLKINKTIENDKNRFNDSLFAYKAMLRYIESKLNIKSNYSYKGNTLNYSFNGLKTVDSALFLFPYYKHRLSINGSTWTVEVDNEYLRNERKEKRLKKRNKN